MTYQIVPTIFGIGTSREAPKTLGTETSSFIGGEKTENITSLKPTSEGGYIITGSFNSSKVEVGDYTLQNTAEKDGLLIKYDNNSNIEWAISIGGERDEIIEDATELESGEIAVVLNSNSTKVSVGNSTIDNTEDGMLIKFNAITGEMISYFLLEDTSLKIESTQDGGMLVIADGYYYLLNKYDSTGQIQWSTNIDGINEITDIVELSNGEIAISAHTNDTTIRTWQTRVIDMSYNIQNNNAGAILKFDKNGKGLWIRTIGSNTNENGEENITSLIETTQGTLMATGYFRSDNLKIGNENITWWGTGANGNGLLIEYDLSGNVLWHSHIKGRGRNCAVAETQDGEFVVLGLYNSNIEIEEHYVYVDGRSNDCGVIIKYNKDREIDWAKGIDGISKDIYLSTIESKEFLIQTTNGKIILGVDTESYHDETDSKLLFNNGEVDIYLSSLVKKDINNFAVTEEKEEATLINAEDGGYFEIKQRHLTEYDKNQVEQWTMNLDTNIDVIESVIETRDEGIIVAGYLTGQNYIQNETINSKGGKDGIIIKYNKEGRVQWHLAIGGTEDDVINSVTIDKKGNITIGGYFYSAEIEIGEYILYNTNETAKGMLIQCDEEGKIKWAKSFAGEARSYINSVEAIEDGTIITGHFANGAINIEDKYIEETEGPAERSVLAKYDQYGKIQWLKFMKPINQSGPTGVIIQDVKQVSDGIITISDIQGKVEIEGHIIGNDNFTDFVLLMKCDFNGNVIWMRTVGNINAGTSNDVEYSFINITSQDEIMIGAEANGRYLSIGDYIYQNDGDYIGDGIIVKYNSNGELQWSTMVNNSINAIVEINDDTILVDTSDKVLELKNQVGVPEVQELVVENMIKQFQITTDVKEKFSIKGGNITGEDMLPYETVPYNQTSQKPILMTPDSGYEIISITVNGEEHPFTANSDGTYQMPAFTNMTEDKHVVVTYALKENKIILQKVDAKDQTPLAGASFRLEQLEAEEPIVVEITTNSQGQAITQLPFGKYKITEIQAPEGYQALEEPIEINFTSGGQNTFTIENDQSAKVIVHHYIKDTTEKVAEDELLEGKIDEKYTTAPKLDLSKYELIKDENGSYILPENATGKYVSGTIEVIYYYEEKQIPLTVHHYIEGTETKVPLQGGGVAEDVRTSGKENEPYETTPVEESILSKDYELVEMPANATGTFAGNEVIVTYYYKQVKRPFILQKQGEDGVNLEGVTFAIQNKQTGETKEYVTDQDGKIEVELVAGDYIITEIKTIEGYDLPENPVTNITIGKEQPTYEITLDNSKTQGNVIVHHFIQGTEEKVPSKEGGVVEDEIKTGTVGEMYATKESDKIQPNYKFAETKGETSGLIKEGTTEVFYYYQLQEPELVEPSISKESNTTKVTHTNQVIDYSITYHATLQEYIGTATVTIVDTLPYEIDTNTSQLVGGVYNETDKTITWTETIENIDTYQNGPKEIRITKEISLLFKNVDQSIQTIANKVVGTVKLETPEKEIPVETTKEIPTEYLTEVEAVKIWEDNNNADGNRPSSIYLQLKKGDALVDEALVTEEEGWKHTFTGLPKYEADGTEISYTVEEREVNAGELKLYDKKIEGNTITNTYKLTDESIKNPKIEKTGTKAITSKDEEIEYNINYTATIENYMGTGRVTIVDTLPYELDESKANDLAGGTYNKEAKTITWVEELGEVDTFTNGAKEVNITKTITVYFKDIDVTAEKFVNTVSGKIDLDTTKETDTQTDTEETTPNFTTEVEAVKVWEDNNNADGNRPSSIYLQLKKGDALVDEALVTEEEGWKHTFTGLPKYEADGTEISYTVEEREVNAGELKLYDKKIEGNTITNTYKLTDESIKNPKIEKTGTKAITSKDEEIEYNINYTATIENYMGTGRVTIVDTLPYELDESKANDLAGGTYNKEAKTITWVEELGEVDTFTNGAKEVNITKTITVYFKDIDVTAEKFVNTVSGKIDLDTTKETDTKTDTEETTPNFTTEVEVIKRWEDNNNENKRRPQSIKFVLIGNSQTYEQEITTLDANPENSNEWKYTFTDLPKYDEKGKEIIYLVNEEEVEENSLYFYEKKVEGNIITNTFKVPEDKITITVNKEWKDTPEQAKQRPQTITFKVLGEGGQEVGSYVLDTSKETSHTFTDLPKYNNKGQEITYTIKEEMDSKFYTQSIGKLTGEDQKEILVTNTFVRPEDNISITVTKTWEDQDNKYDRRPDAIKVQIWNGDVLEAEDFAIEKEDWIVTFDNLPKYDENGQEIVYQVKEEEAYTNDLYNYTVSIGNLVDITENQKECTITNTMTKVPGMVEVLYLDKYTGKEISTTIEKEGIVGERFDVTEDKKEIPGYTLVEEPKDKTGIYTEKLQQKIYYYAKNSNVIVKYLEKGTGEVVAKQEEILGYEGKIYSTEQKQIPDYTFVESTENVAGTMGRDTIEVIYYYAKNTKVIVRYLEKDDTEEDTEDNKVLAQPDTIEGYEGKEYETTAKEIPDYTFIECIGNSKGTMTEDTIEIIYYYSQDSMVIIKYLEKDNTPENTADNQVLAKQEIIPGHEGKEYTTNKKDIPNYTFVESTNNVKGTMGKEPIIVIYYYLPNTKATVQHIDRETGTILKQETKEGVVGDIFQTHAEDFEGYVLVQSPEKPNVPMEKEEIILKYYYAHISAGVIEKHIDVITGEILDSKAHTGNEGDPYDIPAKTFAGYDVVEEKLPTNNKGNMTKERIEVKYYYSKKAQVRVEYIDKQTGEKLVPDIILKGHENDPYETEQKQFENYSLEKIPNNWKGNMTITKNEDGSYQTETVVTYYYIKKSGGVIEKHIDITSGKELAKEEHKGNVGDSYHIPAREFSGYELVKEKLPSNSKGTMQEKEIEVIYYYVKLSKVTVEYIDKDTGEKLDQEEIKGYEKDPYETEEKEFDGYTLVEVPKNATGTMTNKDIVVQYYYRKKVNVEVQYLEKTSGNILAESETLQGYVGDPYETKAKDITYYNLVEQTENTKGKMTKDKITVIYYYEKQNFNLAVDKWVSKVSLDGITQTAKSLETKDEIYKIDIHRTKTETSQIKVTYKIRITNKGEIEGTVDKLTEIIPLGYHLNPKDNKLTWKENKGILVTEDLKEEPIAPGKYKEIEIVLRWDGGGENIGMKDNIVILSKTSNPAGYQDMSKEDDTSKAQMMIAIASGLDSRDRIVVVGIVEVVIAITIGMLVSYRKKNKKK